MFPLVQSYYLTPFDQDPVLMLWMKMAVAWYLSGTFSIKGQFHIYLEPFWVPLLIFYSELFAGYLFIEEGVESQKTFSVFER